MKDYLDQVRTQGPDFQRAITNRKVVDLNRITLGKHWTAQANLNGIRQGSQHYYDPSGQDLPYWNENYSFNGSASYTNQSSFGLNPSVNYYWDRETALADANDPGSMPYWGDQYSIALGVPLWQNFLGAEVRNQDLNNYIANDSSAAGDDFQIPNTLFAAAEAYETLAYDRAVIDRDQDLVQRYEKVAQWAGRHGSELDRLQAQTVIENLNQTLERAQDQERLDRDQLNRLRGIDGSEVGEIENLDQLATEDAESWPVTEPARLDLQSAILSLKAEDYQVKYYRETVKLPVNLNLSAGGNLSGDVPGVMDTFYQYNPALTEPSALNYGVALGVTVPFDIFLPRWTAPLKTVELLDAQQAMDLAETRNSDSQQWEDMTLRFDQSSARIDEATQLEAHQEHKAELGMTALAHGHLDIYEALVFESSYISACLNRLQWVQQRLTLLAQARLYEAKAAK